MPPATQIGGAKADRFSPRSVSKWYWLATADVAVAGAPTRSEIDTDGVDLTPAIASVSGFTESSNFTETPDVNEHQTGKILDGISLEDGSISFYGARDGDDAGSFFDTGDLGYVLHLPYGDTATRPMEVFTVEVGSVSRGKATSGAQLVDVGFGLMDKDESTVPA